MAFAFSLKFCGLNSTPLGQSGESEDRERESEDRERESGRLDEKAKPKKSSSAVCPKNENYFWGQFAEGRRGICN